MAPHFEFTGSGVRSPRALHASRAARLKCGLGDELFSVKGTVISADVVVAQRVAQAMNEVRDAHRFPESAVHPSDVFAAGLIEEIMHLAVAAYRDRYEPDLHAKMLEAIAVAIGAPAADEVLLTFTEAFPPLGVYRGEVTARSTWKPRRTPSPIATWHSKSC